VRKKKELEEKAAIEKTEEALRKFEEDGVAPTYDHLIELGCDRGRQGSLICPPKVLKAMEMGRKKRKKNNLGGAPEGLSALEGEEEPEESPPRQRRFGRWTRRESSPHRLPEVEHDPNMRMVTLPEYAVPGLEMEYETEDKKKMTFKVPENAKPGQKIWVDQGKQDQGEGGAGGGAKVGPDVVSVKLPMGARPGDTIQYTTPEGATMRTEVPEGKRGGQYIAAKRPQPILVPPDAEPNQPFTFENREGEKVEFTIPSNYKPGMSLFANERDLYRPKKSKRTKDIVQLPPNAEPGMKVVFKTKGGAEMEVEVPKGAKPGERITVARPRQMKVRLPVGDKFKRGKVMQFGIDGPKSSEMKEFRIPPNTKPGNIITVKW